MPHLRVLVVEDEPVIAARLERFVREILDPPPALLRRCANLEDALETLRTEPLDLLLLDLELHGEDGFELLRELVSHSFHVVVVSAHTDRAIEAFELGVLDFVPKPFGRDRLEQALARVLDRGRRGDPSTRFLAVRKRGHVDLVEMDEISFVRGAGSYSEIVCRDGRTELHDKNLERLLTVLPPEFERVHRSYIVRASDISRVEIQPGGRYLAHLRDGATVPIGRTRYAELKQRWGL